MARNRPQDVPTNFQSGADDYLAKASEVPILPARIDDLLCRHQWMRNTDVSATVAATQAEPAAEAEMFRFNGKLIDLPALELRAGARTVHLTQMEADLSRHLIRNAGQVVSRKSILRDVGGLY
jgi:DNA-binding response OmpR family regulator